MQEVEIQAKDNKDSHTHGYDTEVEAVDQVRESLVQLEAQEHQFEEASKEIKLTPFVKRRNKQNNNRLSFQSKLKIGPPNDPCEQEADRMADFVVNQISSGQLDSIHKKEKPSLQPKRANPPSPLLLTAPDTIAQKLRQKKGGGDSMPSKLQAQMEQGFAADFSQVRVHTDEEAAQLNQQLGARAFTYGSDVYFNRGEYQPASTEGQRLLAHELTHVVQQGRHRIIQHKIQRSSIKKDSSERSANTENSNVGSSFTAHFRDGKPASSFMIHVVVDQPGTGGDRDTYEGITNIDVGHTFIRLIKTNIDGYSVDRTFGFYPADSVNPVTGPIEVQGRLIDDTGHESDIRASKAISQVAFDAILDYIDAHHQDKYNLDTYNCTDFVLGAAAAGGFNLPDTQGNWPGGGGTNPGDLGEDIREMLNR